MDLPENTLLLMFAYGVLQAGELAFLRVKEYVDDVIPADVSGKLRIRDGLPLLELGVEGHVAGSLLVFRPEASGRAYYRIVELEPAKQYAWQTVQVAVKGEKREANTLVGVNISNGSVPFESDRWQGRDDPFFKEAFQVVKETLGDEVGPAPVDLRPLFRVQMGYLLLWAVLERYAALRYHLAGEVTGKIDYIAQEPAFREALQLHVSERRVVFRTDDPGQRCKLNRDNPKDSLRYYFQVRCNATHRGKAAGRDYDLLLKSSRELLAISEHVVNTAFRDAEWNRGRDPGTA